MLTLYCCINDRSHHFGWSAEQLQLSEKRLKQYGLISSHPQSVKFDRIQTFLTEAISFWWPLSSQVKTPFLKELPLIFQQDQELKHFFSLLETLRAENHPSKNLAQMEMKDYVKGLAIIRKQNFPDVGCTKVELSDLAMAQIVRFVCQNGFRDLTLKKASDLTGIPHEYFISRWETDQALKLWVTAQSHQEFYLFLAPLIGNMSEFNKGHLAQVLEKYLDYIETHESYYRILLWGYLENDPTLQEMNRRSQQDYFETILTLFKKSKPEAQKNAEFFSYLFTSIWKLYASFVWCDSKTLVHKVNLSRVRSQLKSFIVEAVFETF